MTQLTTDQIALHNQGIAQWFFNLSYERLLHDWEAEIKMEGLSVYLEWLSEDATEAGQLLLVDKDVLFWPGTALKAELPEYVEPYTPKPQCSPSEADEIPF